jgi:DNA-binding transcriptional LysR family regulator
LTEEGASYLAAVRPHLDGLKRAHDVAQATCRRRRGKLKVGFVSSLAYELMPRLLETLRAVAPGIEVELFEQPSAEQCRAVRERRLEMGFVFLPVEDQELRMRLLFREPLVAMLPARHALADLCGKWPWSDCTGSR